MPCAAERKQATQVFTLMPSKLESGPVLSWSVVMLCIMQNNYFMIDRQN